MTSRSRAQELAENYSKNNNPTGWFDAFYLEAGGDENKIPWADSAPNPNLIAFLKTFLPPYLTKETLVVGCGLGDDAEELARRGYDVTAFDISPIAIEWAKRRNLNSPVNYVIANALDLPEDWKSAFSFVVEIYTLQSLPEDLRRKAIEEIAGVLDDEGFLLVIARSRQEDEELGGGPPWPLTRSEIQYFSEYGLKMVQFEQFEDDENPPVKRFRALFKKMK